MPRALYLTHSPAPIRTAYSSAFFVAPHLSRRWRGYRPSESLTVCHHIRLRFPQDSGLASNALLTIDKNFPPNAFQHYPHHAAGVIPVASSISLDKARDGEPVEPEPRIWHTLDSR